MREKLELRTHTLAVILTTAWPLVLGLTLMGAATLIILPSSLVLMLIGALAALTVLICAFCVPMYLGTYLFLPASEYRGARILARLGRNESEITGVPHTEILVKQNFIEKAFKVCHIRQKGTAVYYRGVPEPEKVRAWIEASFPVKPAAPAPKKKGKKK